MQMRALYPILLAVAVPLSAGAGAPALTIYNRDFAVVRERIPLDLKPGANVVSFAGATVHLEPDSVVLRDPAGRLRLQVRNTDSQSVEFTVAVAPDEEKVVTYRVRYDWR